MSLLTKTLLSTSLFFTLTVAVSAAEKLATETLFKQKCALCHGIEKKKLGPAVNTMNRDRQTLRQTIIKGKNAMPSYEGKLTDTEIDSLVEYLLANQ